MNPISSILLQNATILVPKAKLDDSVVALKNHSLLIEGNKIARIGPHLDPPSVSTKVIDCTGKILSPGFVDTHHHIWQTQLKGRHADHTLIEYIPTGNMQGYNYTPEDVFWGELGGCLEALNAGTTMVVDHAHMNYSPQHNTHAIAATVSSGIRSVFAYAPMSRVKDWEPTLAMDEPLIPDWAVEQVESLTKSAPFGDGRVHLGLAFDAYSLPKEFVLDLFKRCREAGTKLISSHYMKGPFSGQNSLVDLMDDIGLLGPDVLLAHASNLTKSDGEKLQKYNGSISATPDTELQMGMGYPVCFQDDVKSICSLGVDCHSNNGSSIVSQMRLGLQAERGRRNETLVKQGLAPRRLSTSVHDVFRLGTISGARAVNMQDQIGSLEEGKLADIVIFDGLSPGMACAAEEDIIAAIVLHSSIADIDTVIVDGIIRKYDGKLEPVIIDAAGTTLEPAKSCLAWSDVADELLRSRRRIIENSQKYWSGNLEKTVDGLKVAFHMEESLV